MKAHEIFENLKDDVYDFLYEMVFYRSDAETRITGLGLSILEHLIKILKWEDELNYNKHLQDIGNWLWQIDVIRIKGNNRLKQRDYFQWMYLDNCQTFHDFDKTISRLYHYQNLKSIRTNEEVYNIIQQLFLQISKDIAKDNLKNIHEYLEENDN